MRNLAAIEYLTLDGIMEAPEQWWYRFANEENAELLAAQRDASDAILLGRVTFTDFAAYWPQQTEDASGIADYLNRTSKFVVSTTLKSTEWINTTIIQQNVAQEIRALKQQNGKDIGIVGSARLVQSLMHDDLIDEYRLFVAPIVLGKGKRLFPTGVVPKTLQLVETRPFRSGVIYLAYRRIDE